MDPAERSDVWHRIEFELDRRMPFWKDRIISMEQMPAIQKRESGQTLTDCEVFEALVLSVLTNSVDWSKIERIRHQLKDCFCAFDPASYARVTPQEVQEKLIPWFRERRAGALALRQGLTLLIEAASQLIAEAKGEGLDAYIGSLYEGCGRQPIRLALLLGSGKSPPKIPGLGIPLAAEFLKNLGYDAAKPDRHICRAVGAFRWVEFKSWSDRSGNKPPWPSEQEMVAVMRTLESLAASVDQRTTFVDNAIWLLCAQSGLRSSNEQLIQLGQVANDEPGSSELQDMVPGGRHIVPERADRFAWSPGDVQSISEADFEAALDRQYGKGNRPGVNGFMG